MILQTDRLILRQMCQNDVDDLAQMLKNPRVMYAYEHTFSQQDIQDWLDRQINRYNRYGFGLWAVVLKNTNEMIGQAGLTWQPYKNAQVLEIGYLLKETFWHNGYATEAANVCKEYAFDVLNQSKVYSVIKADNIASFNVAQRIGMQKEDEFVTKYYAGDRLHFLYSVKR